MPFDVVGFYKTQTATTLSSVTPVPDDIYKISGEDLTVQEGASWLVACLQLGISTPKYFEVRQPSLKVPYRFYRSQLCETTYIEPGFTNLAARALPLYAGEKLNVYLQNATAEVSMVALWLASGKCTKAMIDAVNPTHSITGYIDQALTAGTWTRGTITWDQSLEKGTYAIVGMKAGTYKAANPMHAVLRLILPNREWRPGVCCSVMAGDKTLVDKQVNQDQLFTEWSLMPEISFDHDAMPQTAEILSGAANTDHVIELMLQRIK